MLCPSGAAALKAAITAIENPAGLGRGVKLRGSTRILDDGGNQKPRLGAKSTKIS